MLSGLPAGTKCLYLAVRPSFYAPSSSTGVVYVDDIEFYEQDPVQFDTGDYTKWFTFPMNPKRQPKPLVDIGASLLHAPAGKHGLCSRKTVTFILPTAPGAVLGGEHSCVECAVPVARSSRARGGNACAQRHQSRAFSSHRICAHRSRQARPYNISSRYRTRDGSASIIS